MEEDDREEERKGVGEVEEEGAGGEGGEVLEANRC